MIRNHFLLLLNFVEARIKHFLNGNKNVEKNTYIWNLFATLVDAVQSPFLLFIISWSVGIENAGIFSIGYSLATQLLIVGKYNIRNFQVTDQTEEYQFKDYYYTRVVTSFLMLLLLAGYIVIGYLFKNYTLEKSFIIIIIVVTKIIDSIEDVILGMYQQNGRLDIAAKCFGIRVILSILVSTLLIILLNSLEVALLCNFVLTLLVCIIFIKLTYSNFRCPIDGVNKKAVVELLRVCLPLFVGAFCSIYTINAPKYAIDGILSDSMQAIYGFISLPAMMIYIFTSAIFQSQVVHMSTKWIKKDCKGFNRIVMQQTVLLLIVSLIAFMFCNWLGIPILSFIYRTNLYPYHTEFMLLFFGGVFLGISALLSTALTVIRKQNYVLVGYGCIAILAFLLFPWVVRNYELLGSSVFYFVLMGLEMLLFVVLLALGEKK